MLGDDGPDQVAPGNGAALVGPIASSSGFQSEIQLAFPLLIGVVPSLMSTRISASPRAKQKAPIDKSGARLEEAALLKRPSLGLTGVVLVDAPSALSLTSFVPVLVGARLGRRISRLAESRADGTIDVPDEMMRSAACCSIDVQRKN